MPFLRALLIGCSAILISSCGSGGGDDVYTIELSRKDFSDIITVHGVVDPIRSTTVACPMFIDGVIIYLIEDGTYVNAGDTLCIIEDSNLSEQHEHFVTAVEQTRATAEKVVADLRMNFALLEAQVQTNEADMKMAARDSLEILYASPKERRIKELELEKLALEKSKLDRKFEMLKVVDNTEIKRWEVELQRHETNLASIEKRLSELILIAPTEGLAVRAVNRMTGNKMQENDPVWSNMPVITIPQTDESKITITATEQEFKYVSVGDSVYYTFDAMPGNFAAGKITNKTPVGRELKQGSKVKVFTMEASIDTLMHKPDPGFTANCHVVIRELKDTIVVPQISVFAEDSIHVVYVKTPRGFEGRQVLTGMSSSKEAVITAGLEGRERLAMERPPERKIKRTVMLPDSLTVKALPAQDEDEDEENPQGEEILQFHENLQ